MCLRFDFWNKSLGKSRYYDSSRKLDQWILLKIIIDTKVVIQSVYLPSERHVVKFAFCKFFLLHGYPLVLLSEDFLQIIRRYPIRHSIRHPRTRDRRMADDCVLGSSRDLFINTCIILSICGKF